MPRAWGSRGDITETNEPATVRELAAFGSRYPIECECLVDLADSAYSYVKVTSDGDADMRPNCPEKLRHFRRPIQN